MRRVLPNDTDAYKITHHLQYIDGLTVLSSYGEPRLGAMFDLISYIGGQMVVHDELLSPVTAEMIAETYEECIATFGTDKYFNKEGWEKVMKLGYLPMKIRTLPEGYVVKPGTMLFTLENDRNHPWFAKMLNSLESLMLHYWKPTTIASNSMHIKSDILPFAVQTGTPELISFMVNDFGLRGAAGLEDAARSGGAFLFHFRGSDNMPASRYLKDVYGLKGRALSVWATEHSVATSFGPGRGEIDYVLTQLNNAPLNAIVSIVIDSYDGDEFCNSVIGHPEVKAKVIERSLAGGRTVWRPDSGIPTEKADMLLGNLERHFGTEINRKGYKVIAVNTGGIQGDGMKRATIKDFYQHIVTGGWSSDNYVTGSGGGLLVEGFTRDSLRNAIKASYGEKNGVSFDIQKKPKTDLSKSSKPGLLKNVIIDGVVTTVPISHPGQDIMRTLYDNGNYYPEKGEDIVARAESYFQTPVAETV